MNAQFFGYVVFFTFAGIAFALAALLTSWFLRPWRARGEKLTTYECGEEPIGTGWHRYNVRYYTFALLFLVFDIAGIFLLLFALIYKESIKVGTGSSLFWEVLLFLFILLIAWIYAWRKGNLEWV
ncbi:NADH-quinone oxidoreductase subunit A [bacterium]|nr:NADH-quinone oxidoreductase subunit A [bacterium]